VLLVEVGVGVVILLEEVVVLLGEVELL